MKSYFTFGTAHEWELNGVEITHNHVLEIEGANPAETRKTLWGFVGPKFAFQYDNEPPDMQFFPAGILKLSDIVEVV